MPTFVFISKVDALNVVPRMVMFLCALVLASVAKTSHSQNVVVVCGWIILAFFLLSTIWANWTPSTDSLRDKFLARCRAMREEIKECDGIVRRLRDGQSSQ